MSANEVVNQLQEAIAKLEAIMDDVVHTGKITPESMQVALLMISPVIRILKGDVQMLESCKTPEQLARVELATERAGDVALARAVLGGVG